jgi:hypothetical protein
MQASFAVQAAMLTEALLVLLLLSSCSQVHGFRKQPQQP